MTGQCMHLVSLSFMSRPVTDSLEQRPVDWIDNLDGRKIMTEVHTKREYAAVRKRTLDLSMALSA